MSARLLLPRWIAGTLLLLAGQAVAELRVSEAWIREPPPVATPLAGYLRIANTGPEPRVLNAVRTPRASSVELHRTAHEDGVARMQRLRQLPIPPGGEVVLEPGGVHLMIFGFDGAPRAGDEIDLTLEFSDGACLPVRFVVVPSAGSRRMPAQSK